MAMDLTGIDTLGDGTVNGFIHSTSSGFDEGLKTLRTNLLGAHEKLVGGEAKNPNYNALSSSIGGKEQYVSKYKPDGTPDTFTNDKSAAVKLSGDPGNPGLLAEYQKTSSEYQLYRNAQSSAVKMYKDLAQGTISKWS
jgi:type III secretion protein F